MVVKTLKWMLKLSKDILFDCYRRNMYNVISAIPNVRKNIIGLLKRKWFATSKS